MEPLNIVDDRPGLIYEELRRGEEPAGWETLTGRQAYVLLQRAIAARTLADIANELGISRERVRQHEAQALRKLISCRT